MFAGFFLEKIVLWRIADVRLFCMISLGFTGFAAIRRVYWFCLGLLLIGFIGSIEFRVRRVHRVHRYAYAYAYAYACAYA